MNDELELKYAVADLAAVEAFLDAHFPPRADGDGWHEQKITDRYFDTTDQALGRAGFGARLRRSGGRTTVGLKSDVGLEEGIHHRRELEAEAAPTLDAQDWPPSEARRLVRRLAGERRLRERFVLFQLRRERAWPGDGGACLFALDLVSVRSGGQRLAELRQLEIELREGDARFLRKIDATIAGSGVAVHEPRSKMAIAAEIVAAAAPLRADEELAEAGRRVLRRHLERMVEREQATRTGDLLALKQMRVATRRMRATWRLFDSAYNRRQQRRYVGELRRIARRLGAVRDLDVLLESLGTDAQLEPLARAWRNRRATAWRKLLATLDSETYASFLADYREFTHTAGLACGRLGRLHVGALAGSRVWSAYETVRAYGAAKESPAVATLHALRIDGKRLRYALETFGDVLPRRATADLIARLTRMQDHLGALNDADIAAREAESWLAANPKVSAAARRAVKAHVAHQQAEVERLRGSFARTWRGVGGRAFGRSLGRAIADLG